MNIFTILFHSEELITIITTIGFKLLEMFYD